MWVVALPLASWVSGPGDLFTVNKGPLEGWEGGPLWEGKSSSSVTYYNPPCCCCSVAKLCRTLCNLMDCSTPGLPVPHHLPEFTKFMSIESGMPSNHHSLCHPLLLLSSVFPSIRVFSSESALHIKWPKCWSFSFSMSFQ